MFIIGIRNLFLDHESKNIDILKFILGSVAHLEEKVTNPGF